MFDTILILSLIILSVSIVASLYRVIIGPSMPDRVIALDTIGINIIGIVGVLSIMLEVQAFLEIILLIGILAFIGTIAFSKFIERGVVIEHDRNK
jgi:multicomponent Na+:H+ antiporter subunit F